MSEPTNSTSKTDADAVERGRLKVFIGMAPGVGKTYQMLLEAHEELQAGRDVVIAVLETHGRFDTARLEANLEVLSRRIANYRGTDIDEMDLPALLARKPELCLIDELAHTNAPGFEHHKRYEDVEDALKAGIDVFSTLNVQHLESLNDLVAELCGVRVRETIPDAILNRADDVVLIDITPEELLDRLNEGKIYPQERIESALQNFFKIENLTTLREIALRQVAEEIEAKRLTKTFVSSTREDSLVHDVNQAVQERLLALVSTEPKSQRLVRRAWRSARRLSAELDLLHVVKPGKLHQVESDPGMRALRQLASVLGVTLLVEEGDDIAEIAGRVARDRGTTYVLIGEPSTKRHWFRASFPDRLMRQLPGIDLRITADHSNRIEEHG